MVNFSCVFLPPATKLREGNAFTPVCHSVHRGGLCPGGLCPGGLSLRGSLSRGEGSLSRGSLSGVSVRRASVQRGISVKGGLCQRDPIE